MKYQNILYIWIFTEILAIISYSVFSGEFDLENIVIVILAVSILPVLIMGIMLGHEIDLIEKQKS